MISNVWIVQSDILIHVLFMLLHLFTYTVVQHDFHMKWCSCYLTVARRVLHVEQKLLTLPEHLRSPTVFSEVRVARFLVFWLMFCRSLFVPLAFSVDHSVVRLLITPLGSSNFCYPAIAEITLNNKTLMHKAIPVSLFSTLISWLVDLSVLNGQRQTPNSWLWLAGEP